MKWKLIAGFDGYYRVSDTGRVQSCRKHGGRVAGLKGEWREMKLTEDSYGYFVVGLVKNGRKQVIKKSPSTGASDFRWSLPERYGVSALPGPRSQKQQFVQHQLGDEKLATSGIEN